MRRYRHHRFKPKKEWSNSWWFLKTYLDGLGFKVYPTEIVCSLKHCPVERRSFVADVAAFKDDDYYAFEFKSAGDKITSKRLREQIRNYSVSFDYVIVVAQVPRHDASVNPKRGVHAKEIVGLGAGLWTVQFPRGPNPDERPAFKVLAEPQRQNPHPENKQWIINKFTRYVFGKPVPEDPNQKRLGDF